MQNPSIPKLITIKYQINFGIVFKYSVLEIYFIPKIIVIKYEIKSELLIERKNIS